MADEADDLDYSESNVGLAQAQGVRKNISLKLKGKGRGRGRRGGKVRRGGGGASKKVTHEDETEEVAEEAEEIALDKQLADSNLEDVISKLETPSFSPMDRTFPEPLHQNKKLRWDHKVNLIGEKVIDPLIHCCEKCSLPILNYGRMIPCKHVFCYDCAKKAEKVCPKCDEKIQRTEPSALGTVFMCTYGGTRHSPGACGRTYLSQRDLQAHINHRHVKPSSSSSSTSVGQGHTSSRDPRGHPQQQQQQPQQLVPSSLPMGVQDSRASATSVAPPPSTRQYSPSGGYPVSSTMPASSTGCSRPNLITVPIQDDGGVASHMPHPQTHVPAYAPSAAPAPMPHPGSAYTPHAPYQQQQHPTPSSVSYSQAPPITTLTFSQPPPPVHHQPPLHQPGSGGAAAMYSTPPPPPVHHQPPATYNAPPRAPPAPRQPMHPPRFHEEGAASYMPQWAGPGAAVPPPPARASLPPGPISAPPPSASNQSVGLLATPRGPADPAYRQPYYQ